MSDYPHEGAWVHGHTGDESAVVFEEVEPGVWEPRLPNGSPVRFEPGDRLAVDTLGPGQSIQIPTTLTGRSDE